MYMEVLVYIFKQLREVSVGIDKTIRSLYSFMKLWVVDIICTFYYVRIHNKNYFLFRVAIIKLKLL